MDLKVVDNTEMRRFEARTEDDEVAGFIEYRRGEDSVLLVQTEVDDRYQGQRVGSRLVRGVLEALRAEGAAVRNDCPFIRRYLDRHPQQYDWVRNEGRAAD